MANAATVQPEWLLVDAENEVLGRLASKVAMLVRGKHKATFTPHVNCGDHVIVINADKVRFTGGKMDYKEYQRYSGHPGGQYGGDRQGPQGPQARGHGGDRRARHAAQEPPGPSRVQQPPRGGRQRTCTKPRSHASST
jgi:ribosomal protein L13